MSNIEEKNSQEGMGLKTRRMLKDFIHSLKPTTIKKGQKGAPQHTRKLTSGNTTERRIKDLWHKLKKQLMDE